MCACLFISDLSLSHKRASTCTCASGVLLACLCCCCWLTWTTIHLYELIHCCLEQPLAPLRLCRPCKTWILCWMSNTNELLNILTLPPGKRQRGLMEQFHSVVVRHKKCQFLNENRAFSHTAHTLFHQLYAIVAEIYFKSRFDCKKLVLQCFFFTFPYALSF